MSPIDKLAQIFERFPGIGPRQARRFVQFLLVASPALRNDLADQIRTLGLHTAQCKRCYRWYPKAKSTGTHCDICSDEHRDQAILFIVEKDADIDNVERSGYKGLYFCLGGTIPLGSEETERFVRTGELLKRTQDDGAARTLRELILGLSATTEGDHTRQILQERLQPLAEQHSFKISSLGRGLSTGSELEYADPDTIAEALGNRH